MIIPDSISFAAMPRTTGQSLREQAKECLEASQRTDDEAVKNELLAAAAWLHGEAVKLEKLLNSQRGGGGPGSPAKRRNGRKMTGRFSRPPPPDIVSLLRRFRPNGAQPRKTAGLRLWLARADFLNLRNNATSLTATLNCVESAPTSCSACPPKDSRTNLALKFR